MLTSAIFVVNLLLHRPVIDALLFSLAIAVGITLQLLPAVVTTSLATGARRLARQKPSAPAGWASRPYRAGWMGCQPSDAGASAGRAETGVKEATVELATARTLDVTDVDGGLPLAWTAVAMATMHSGDVVEVRVADPAQLPNFSAWCRTTGNRLLEHTLEDGALRLVIRKR
jgi:TusA-related sulfurtransferase